MDFKVGITEQAIFDLESAVAFVARKDLRAAVKIGEEIFHAGYSLGILPRRGTPVSGHKGYRKLIVRDLLILYRIDEQRRLVEILRNWDGRRDPGGLSLP